MTPGRAGGPVPRSRVERGSEVTTGGAIQSCPLLGIVLGPIPLNEVQHQGGSSGTGVSPV